MGLDSTTVVSTAHNSLCANSTHLVYFNYFNNFLIFTINTKLFMSTDVWL